MATIKPSQNKNKNMNVSIKEDRGMMVIGLVFISLWVIWWRNYPSRRTAVMLFNPKFGV